MTPHAQPDIIQILEDSRQELLAAASGFSDAQAGTAAESKWSALQCLEHVTIVEDRFLAFLQKAERGEAPRPDRSKEAMLSERVADRSNKLTAPEIANPKGSFTSMEQALTAFQEARERTIQFAQEHAEHLDSLQTNHPRFGEMNGTELLQVMAAHARRHAAQIRETRASQ